MRTLIVVVAMMLPAAAIAAEQQKKNTPRSSANPCAQYGEGFVQVKGSTTCVKVSGSVEINVGTKPIAPSR